MKVLLFTLITLVAITSTGSGILVIENPNDTLVQLTLDLLTRTPFKNFLIPGVLLTLVGVVNLPAVSAGK